MKRKVVSVILATAMVASMVAGCGGSNNASTNNAGTTTDAAASDAAGRNAARIWNAAIWPDAVWLSDVSNAAISAAKQIFYGIILTLF